MGLVGPEIAQVSSLLFCLRVLARKFGVEDWRLVKRCTDHDAGRHGFSCKFVKEPGSDVKTGSDLLGFSHFPGLKKT